MKINDNETVTVGLDIVFDRLDQTLTTLQGWTKAGLKYSLIDAHGPGGGNPYFHITGPLGTLRAVFAGYCEHYEPIEFFILSTATITHELASVPA